MSDRYSESVKNYVSAIINAVGAELNVMIIGRTGVGKSSLGNLLLGYEAFKVGDSESTTTTPSIKGTKLHGLTLNVIDTAGLFDSSGVAKDAEHARALLQFLDNNGSPRNVHVVLFCNRFEDRTDASQQSMIANLTNVLNGRAVGGVNLWDRAIIVFTFGGVTVRDYNNHVITRTGIVQQAIKTYGSVATTVPATVADNLVPQLPNGASSLENVLATITRVARREPFKVELPRQTVVIEQHRPPPDHSTHLNFHGFKVGGTRIW